ncbi:MAG: amidohydrolase [Alphaproteobacteria bacterium]|nr:amidohydrolase [Alphaproteobacteria bacterium]
MTSNHTLRSDAVRAKLEHPVIDGDGHMIEVEPVVVEYMKQVGGPSLVEDYVKWCDARWARWYNATPEERRRRHMQRITYWGIPARNTTDRATCMLPGLMRARLDELGLDLAIVYPTMGNLFIELPNADFRRGVVRAINKMNADLYRPYRDRLIPAAVIPMHTPAEALAELDATVRDLGFKSMVLQGGVRRPIAQGDAGGRFVNSYYVDYLALDSEYDYDPVWQRCLDLKVAPTTHSGSQGLPNRTSPTSFVFNHLGHFAAHHEGMCKALFLGGVTQRFPALRFAFLEGGVGWAVSLYNQIFEHWEKRNIDAMMEHLDPSLVDRELLVRLFEKHGDAPHRAGIAQVRDGDGRFWSQWREDPKELDEFRASGVRSPRDIYERFVPRFFFGCEADDRMIALAFDGKLNRLGARLNAIFSSDIGHWDVIDAAHCLAEAYELVDDGLLGPEDFRDFTFGNAVRLHAAANPDFFEGTVLAEAARREIARPPRVAAE